MHLTAPGSTCSIRGIWKSTRQRYGSSRPGFLSRVYAASICFVYGGPMGLSARGAECMVAGLQRAERQFAVAVGLEQP